MRGRVLITATVAATLVAVLPAAAAVQNQHTFSLGLSAKKPSTNSGATVKTSRTYTAPPAGTKPVTVTRIVFTLPPGTKIDLAAAKARCSIAVLKTQGGAGCKPGSTIGNGSAVAITGTPLDPVTETAALYATPTGMAAYITGLQTILIPLSVKANKITADVPRVCLPPGTLANDCPTGEAVVTKLTIRITATQNGKRRLLTTPPSCGGKWTSRANYTYSNGDKELDTSSFLCRKK